MTAMARNSSNSNRAARLRFATLLSTHMKKGTRPGISKEPWSFEGFAGEVDSPRKRKDYASPRSVSNWCKGKRLPSEIEPILRALFGPPGSNRHDEREQLRKAFQAAQAEKAVEKIRQTEPDPAGARWTVQAEQLVIDRTAGRTDEQAATDPIRRQLQSAVQSLAEELIIKAKRLSNSRTWNDIAPAGEALLAVVSLDPRQVVERLGETYASLLRLGRFLETDARVRSDPTLMFEPLDPDIHGSLSVLVRTAAPWLRGYPTVAAMDDAAGKALVRGDLHSPAREFTRIAREHEAISAQDAEEIESLAGAAGTEDFQGQKAGARAVGSAKNLLLVSALLAAAELAGTSKVERPSRSILVQRVFASLASAQIQIAAIASTMSDDMRHALQALVEESQALENVPDSHPPASNTWSPDSNPSPRMIKILAGEFTMGSPDGEGKANERPARRVVIDDPFEVGAIPTTRGEFAAFMEATKHEIKVGANVWDGRRWKKDSSRSWLEPGFYQEDNHPVVCVSWEDAKAYMAWLSDRSRGGTYRLLSEVEWEYCCRAGTSTPYSTGKGITTEQANFSNVARGTTSVLRFPPNPWGLHDMHGNVYEWCEDDWHNNYRKGAPTTGTVWQEGDGTRRIIRGGSWFDPPWKLRSACRNWERPDIRFSSVGFRVARTL
jgi:formylglycine-generating enzyme required for sulfatase activity